MALIGLGNKHVLRSTSNDRRMGDGKGPQQKNAVPQLIIVQVKGSPFCFHSEVDPWRAPNLALLIALRAYESFHAYHSQLVHKHGDGSVGMTTSPTTFPRNPKYAALG